MTVSAGIFKAKCLQLMDDVQVTHKEIVITKRGKPVAKLVPIDRNWKSAKSPVSFMKGTVKILGDIIAPIDVKWNANE